ncbi:MAG: hypothetical protein KC466_07415, partial [Myxococcales bacterium]|nr:hypothetical protein [Myxococcales bacterium]
MSARWILLIAGVVGLLSGCGGSGRGLDANGRPIGEGGGGGPLVATWRSIQDNIFTPRCTECHAGGAAPLGLRLDEAVSYEQLVGVRSVQIPQLFRVDPGDPDASYLVQKVEGAAGILGGRMPLERAALSAQQIAVIRQWIADGAPRGDAFRVGAEEAIYESLPDAVALPDGGFFVAWSRTDREGRPLGLLGVPVAADGTLGARVALSEAGQGM